jgi:hypothetical protein
MKRIYEFITKLNQVLLLLACLGVLGLMAKEFLGDWLRDRRPLSLPIVQATNGSEQPKTRINDVDFLGWVDDLRVFAIRKGAIDAPQTGFRGDIASKASGAGWGGGAMTVNIVFCRGAQKVRSLLPGDGLVLRHEFPRAESEHSSEMAAFLFQCVTEDTDGDHRLGPGDRNDLWIVSRKLDGPDMVISGIMEYETLNRNHVMVKIRQGDSFQFFDVDVVARTKTEVAWK